MGATVSGPSITADETAETITLIAGATIPTSFLRVFGCETMTVTAEAEVTRKIKALDRVRPQRVKQPLGRVSHRHISPIKGGARSTVPI